MLPEVFVSQMKSLLSPDEFRAFLGVYDKPPTRGIRFNKLKLQNWLPENPSPGEAICHEVEKLSLNGALRPTCEFTQVPWCSEGFSFIGDYRPAKSLLYNTGLFYIQEPSAMCPVEVLMPKPGERVLDICAAPGGKTVHIAGHMYNTGILISNDKSPSRCRGLIKNIELAGITNTVVTSEEPRKLVRTFLDYFDKILVDAPCSGEGMFRRDKDLVSAYNENKPQKCVNLQKEILHHASTMLKPGGKMVYSTCTFNPYENEKVIAEFLVNHTDFNLEKIDADNLGVEPGRPEWVNDKYKNLNLNHTARIWPHKANGEGHFVALLKKDCVNPKRWQQTPERLARSALAKGFAATSEPGTLAKGLVPLTEPGDNAPPPEFADFCRNYLNNPSVQGFYTAIGANLYLQPEKLDLSGIRVARSGFFLGEIKKGRFAPSQALAMALTGGMANHTASLNEDEAERYLRGESISYEQLHDAHKPWMHINYKGLALGWARLVDNRLKNSLPVSWVKKDAKS